MRVREGDQRVCEMGATHPPVYEEVFFSEFEWVEDDEMYYYQCPCGDMFEISAVRSRPGRWGWWVRDGG